MQHDRVGNWRARGFDAPPTTIDVACGVAAMTQLIRAYLDTGALPYPSAPLLILIDLPHGFAFRYFDAVAPSMSPVIVITPNSCPEYLEDVWDRQPTVLLACDQFLDHLRYAITRAAHGQRYRLTPGAATRLTLHERRLLHHVAHGWSIKEIATALDRQPKTVSNYLTQVGEKLHLPDRAAMVLYYWGQTTAR